jgi:hypothetical protein
MIVRVKVPGKVVGKNARNGPRGGPKLGILLRTEAREFMERVALYGLAARNASEWPREMLAPRLVRLTVDVWNTKHDAAASSPLIADALEGVYYHNDRVVCYDPQELPLKDGGEARVEITLELLAVRTAQEIAAMKAAMESRLFAKFRRGKGKKKKLNLAFA